MRVTLWFGLGICGLAAIAGVFGLLVVLATSSSAAAEPALLWTVLSALALVVGGVSAWAFRMALLNRPWPLVVTSAIMVILLLKQVTRLRLGDPSTVYLMPPLTFFGISLAAALWLRAHASSKAEPAAPSEAEASAEPRR